MASVDLEMLRAHNPVPDPDAAVDMAARAAALERALACDGRPAFAALPARWLRRRATWWPLVAIIGPLVLAAAALAASGLLSGAPYDPPWAQDQTPQVDLGAPVARAARTYSRCEFPTRLAVRQLLGPARGADDARL